MDKYREIKKNLRLNCCGILINSFSKCFKIFYPLYAVPVKRALTLPPCMWNKSNSFPTISQIEKIEGIKQTNKTCFETYKRYATYNKQQEANQTTPLKSISIHLFKFQPIT